MVNQAALDLLKRLQDSPAPLAGEALALELGVSRVALWKRVQALRAEGYPVEAGREGYRLAEADLVRPWEFPEGSVHSYPELGSTMDKALELALAGAAAGTVVHADRQSAGRGQHGRSWASGDGNLTFTLLLQPALPAAYAGALALEALCALADTLERVSGVSATLKWPNDLLVGGRKVAGVLIETYGSADRPRWFSVGVGLNVRSAPALDRPAGALEPLAGRRVDRRVVLDEFRRRLGAWAREPRLAPDRWGARLTPSGPWTVWRFDGAVARGRPQGFGPDGSLLLAGHDNPSPLRYGTAVRIEGAYE